MCYAYCFFKLQLKKSNKNNKFLFKFNVVDDDKNVDVFKLFNTFKKHSLKMISSKNYCCNHVDILK